MLVHPAASVSSASANTVITATTFAILVNRPARPRKLEVEYFSVSPRSFSFNIVLADGEVVYRSPTLLSGPIPRRFTSVIPRSSDYSVYQGGDPVVQISHATNPQINYVFNIKFEYSFPLAATAF
jgi:hypothetical protein